MKRSMARVCFPLARALPSRRLHRGWAGSGGVSYLGGGGSYRIRILMYRDESCMYPEGYTYL